MKYEVTIKEACNSGFWVCLEPNDWIALIAVIIAMIAAVASWMAIYSQKKINEKNQEAIIVPGIKSIEANIESILSDWDSKEDIPKKFSRTTLPIWNYGNSPVFNIGYCYYIENIDKLINEEKNEIGHGDSYAVNVLKNQDSYDLGLNFKDIKKGKQVSYTQSIHPYIRNVDVIKPKESVGIFLPDYFIILLNDYFLNTPFVYKEQPSLELKVFYDDINFQTWEQRFRIFVPNSYNLKGETLTTIFQYEIIQTKRKVKRLTVQENEERMKKRQKKELKNRKEKDT